MKILSIKGGVQMGEFETPKGEFRFIAAQYGAKSVWETIDTILNIKTGDKTKHKRIIFKNVEAKRISKQNSKRY
jgi:predicted RNA-binding protein with PUA domain